MRRFVEWTKDWTTADRPAAFAERRAYLGRLSNVRLALLDEWVRAMRTDRWELAKELVAPIVRELETVALTDMKSNPFALLEFGDVRGDSIFAAKRRFEALCLFDLAIGVDLLEQEDPASVVENDGAQMMSLLEQELFRTDELRVVTVWSYHDPEDAYRVHEGRVGFDERLDAGSPYERRNPEPCRVLKDGTSVRVSQRPKGRFETLLKIHRKGVVKDRCGVKFIVPSVSDAKKLLASIRRLLKSHGAIVRSDGDTLVPTAIAADPGNAASSPRYRVAKLMARLHGRWHELQVQTFAGYVSAQYALDGENHELYRLGQGLDHQLPLLYPGEIYLEERSWKNPDLRKMLRDRYVQKLDWRVERLTTNGR